MAVRIQVKRTRAAFVLKKEGVSGEWMFAHDGAARGPMTLPELKNAALAGQVSPDDQVWRIDTPARARAGFLPWLLPAGAAPRAAIAENAPVGDADALACPACRAVFPPEDALFVAQTPDLPHDLLLGPGHNYRFRPTHFTATGVAVDPGGMETVETACPACHAALAAAGKTAAPAPRPAAGGRARDKDAAERLPPHLATTEGVRKLVVDIRAILSRSASARLLGDVLARQYAELCRRANARLALCKRFIEAGQRSEAYDQAEQSPRLPDLCAMLPFEDLDQWQQLCARSRWPLPESIAASTVEAVAACCREAAPFEPALQALRRAVRGGRATEALEALYTLMLMDPDNPQRAADATAFEEVRQIELFAAAEQAIAAGDFAALNGPAGELAGRWLAPPDPEALAVVLAACDRLRAADAAQRGTARAQQFAAACTAQDFAAAVAADAAYAAVVAGGHFQPDETTRRAVEAGRAWFAPEAARRAADAAFARDVAALEQILARPDPGEEAERLATALRASGREAPAALLARADRAARRRRARLAWRRRLRLTGRVAVVVVPLAVVVTTIWFLALAQQRRAWAERLSDAIRSEDLPRFDDAVANMRDYRFLFGTALTRYPAIAALRDRRNDLAARVADRATSYQEVLAALQRNEADGFRKPATTILALLERGRKAAKTVAQLVALDRFETPWRADQTARLEPMIAQLPPAPPPADIFARQPFAVATQEVARYCAAVDAAAALTGADAAPRAQLAPFLALADTCRSNLAPRLALLATAAQASHLDGYLDALVRYADRYTNDTLSVAFSRTVANRRAYRAALQAAADAQQREAARAVDAGAWTQARRAIVALGDIKALTDLRWVHRKDTGDLVFVLGREKPESGFHGTWAEVYQPLGGDTAPVFKRERITDIPPYNLGLATQPSAAWRHTDLMHDMCARVSAIDRPADGARYLEELIRALGTMPVWSGSGAPGSNELPNVAFKVQLMVFLTEHLARLSPWLEWGLVLEELRAADAPEASWICLKNAEVKRIDRDGFKALARMLQPGGLLTRLEVHRAAVVLAGRVPLVWAGYADFTAPGTVHWKTTAPPLDVAVLRVDAARVPVTVCPGPPDRLRLPLSPGEPLLAWSDGAGFARRNAALAGQFKELDAATVLAAVPPWWPHVDRE